MTQRLFEITWDSDFLSFEFDQDVQLWCMSKLSEGNPQLPKNPFGAYAASPRFEAASTVDESKVGDITFQFGSAVLTERTITKLASCSWHGHEFVPFHYKVGKANRVGGFWYPPTLKLLNRNKRSIGAPVEHYLNTSTDYSTVNIVRDELYRSQHFCVDSIGDEPSFFQMYQREGWRGLIFREIDLVKSV